MIICLPFYLSLLTEPQLPLTLSGKDGTEDGKDGTRGTTVMGTNRSSLHRFRFKF